MFARLSAKHTFCCILLFKMNFLIQTMAFAQTSQRMWSEIQSPTSENILYAQLLHENLGYIFAEKQQLFEYRDGTWQQIDMPAGVLVTEIKVVDSGDIFAIVQPLDSYRQTLMRLQNGAWLPMNPPNVHSMRRLYFPQSDSGWVNAAWGEMMLFRKGMWKQVHFPSPCHVETFIPGWQGELFAITDCPPNEASEIVQLIDGKWQLLPNNLGIGLRSGIVDADGTLLAWSDRAEIYAWDGSSFKTLAFPTKIKRLALFSNGSGFHLVPDGIYSFSALRNGQLQAMPLSNAKDVNNITLTADSSGWLYGRNGRIWSLGAKNEIQSVSSSYRFAVESKEIGYVSGMAVLRTSDESSDIYFVDNEYPNLIASRIDLPEITARISAASKYHLDEPQQNYENYRMYDFGVITGDFNGDFLEDVFLTGMYGRNTMFFNGGKSSFVDATKWAGLASDRGRFCGAATADIDNDGDLDIYAADEFGPGKLYVNNGYGRFSEQAAARNAIVPHFSTSACFADIDMDGWIDLAVTTYRDGTWLFRNNGNGSFENITNLSPDLQPDSPDKCSSLTFADYDNDGDFDLFICRLFVSNALLQNDGAGVFHDVTTQAGVSDSALSRGAVFFDPDQDGDLELFISNMGHDHFYENLGNGTFRANHGKVRYKPTAWVPAEFVSDYSGGLSNGTVVFDYGADGDMDFWVGHFDGKSNLFRNQKNSPDFLQFRLSGIDANPSAIGATVSLFPAGTNFDPDTQLGVRMIESASSLGSHSEKIIHFGVDTLQTYDAEVRFPGGKRHHLRNLAPGTIHKIDELAGSEKIIATFKNSASSFLYGHRSGIRYLQAALVAAMMMLIFFLFKEKFAWDPAMRLALLAGTCAGFLVAHHLVVYQSDISYFSAPLVASFVGGFLTVTGWNWKRLYSIPNADFDSLALRLTGFAHSEHYANVLASIDLHLRNFQPIRDGDEAIAQRFLSSIHIVKRQMQPDLQMIIACSRSLDFQLERALALHRAWRRLLRLLNKIESDLQHHRRIAGARLDQLSHALEEVRLHMRGLRKSVEQRESVDVAKVLTETTRHLNKQAISCKLILQANLPIAYLPESSLRTIVDELIANALRAMQQSKKRQLELAAQQDDDHHVRIEIRDSGPGVARDRWQSIFQRGVSTKKAGGIGLFLARQLLERHGASLDIKDSSEHGTTMQITLQRAKS